MDKAHFNKAVLETRTLIESFFGHVPVRAGRHWEAPTSLSHLSWMLTRALYYHDKGELPRASRWLGHVQGTMIHSRIATVAEIGQANMPSGEVFDPESDL